MKYKFEEDKGLDNGLSHKFIARDPRGRRLICLMSNDGISVHPSKEDIERCYKEGFSGRLRFQDKALKIVRDLIKCNNVPEKLLVKFKDNEAKWDMYKRKHG